MDVRERVHAGRRQRIALFGRDGMRFSLIPSGRAVLGYDGTRFVPSPQQAASYADSAGEYGLPAITEFIDSMTSRQRMAEFPAMLVAVEALAPCLTPAADDPLVQQIVAANGGRPGGRAMTWSRDGNVEVEFDEAGQVRSARVMKRVSYHDAIKEAASPGVRPATPEEWEHANDYDPAFLDWVFWWYLGTVELTNRIIHRQGDRSA